jgi:hypothetical protein
MRAIARAQTPFPRQRRHCCQTASQGGKVRQIAPLAAGPSQEQDRLDHPPAFVDGWLAMPSSRIEEVLDHRPLLVGQLDHRAQRALPILLPANS